jgi:hypothetical protein
MAKKKISDLSSLTSPATGDLLPIVDVSDTSQAASGSTKKITVANFANNLPASTFANLQNFTAGINPNASGGQTFNNYDFGTWTPTVIGSTTAGGHTYTTQIGKWVRIGNQIKVTFDVRINGAFGGTGNIRISGLPTAANSTDDSGIAWGYVDNVAFTAGDKPMGFVDSNQIYMSLFRFVAAGTGMANWTATQMGTSTRLQGSAIYQV